MADITNPVINRAIAEQVRPMAETARNLLVQAQASAPSLAADIAALTDAADADILQDGRIAEGIAPLTVAEFRACIGLLSALVAQVNGDARLAAVLAACVRPVRVGG